MAVITPSGIGRHTLARIALAVVFLAAIACAGCADPQAQAPRGSVASCVTFGIHAIESRVVVAAVPPACRGLSRAQVNLAVASAVHQVASRVPGKSRQRRRAAMASHYLAHLISSPPAAHPAPPVTAPQPASQASNGALGVLALCCWLLTVSFGTYMMARWMSRRVLRRAFRAAAAADGALSPLVSFTHFTLAVGGLLAWVAYLVTSTALVGWLACAALLPTAGFGMSLVFLAPGRRPTLVVAAHIALAAATMLFTLLTVVGP